MAGGVVMVLAAFFFGAPALVTATAVTALVSMLWRLRGGVTGYVMDATASVFTLVYVPFLGGFVALLLAEDRGAARDRHLHPGHDRLRHRRLRRRGARRQAPDGPGDLARRSPGRGSPAPRVSCVVVGWLTVDYLLDGDWWVGVLLGLIAVVMATLGDLCESVIKRDLGIKDMSQIIPGPRRPDGPARLAARHGGADLAAAALPRLLVSPDRRDGSGSRLFLVRHGRPLVDPERPAATWRLDPAATSGTSTPCAPPGGCPPGATWCSSPEPKARRPPPG